LKIVVCLHRCRSANESETITYLLGKGLSVAYIYMTPIRKNLPEESIKKEHTTELQWIVRLQGLQPKNFGINNDVNTSKSPEGIMNKWIHVCLSGSRY